MSKLVSEALGDVLKPHSKEYLDNQLKEIKKILSKNFEDFHFLVEIIKTPLIEERLKSAIYNTPSDDKVEYILEAFLNAFKSKEWEDVVRQELEEFSDEFDYVNF